MLSHPHNPNTQKHKQDYKKTLRHPPAPSPSNSLSTIIAPLRTRRVPLTAGLLAARAQSKDFPFLRDRIEKLRAIKDSKNANGKRCKWNGNCSSKAPALRR